MGWERISEDVLVKVLELCSLFSISQCALVCRSWNHSTKNAALWAALCKRSSWPLKGRDWFIPKAIAVHTFATSEYSVIAAETKERERGYGGLFCPPPRRFYSYEEERFVDLDKNLAVLMEPGGGKEVYVWNYEKNSIKAFGSGFFGKKFELPWFSCCDASTEFLLLSVHDIRGGATPKLVLLDLATSVQSTLRGVGHSSTITSVKLGKTYAISTSYDHTAIIWHIPRKTLLFRLFGHSDTVWNGDITEDYAATCSDDNSIRIWDLNRSGKCHRVLSGHTACPMSIKFDVSDPNTYCFSAGYDRTIILWNFQSGEIVRRFLGHTDIVFDLSVTPYVIASSSRDTSIIVWDRDTGKAIRKLEKHASDVKCVCFLSGRFGFISAGFDGKAYCWRFKQGSYTSVEAPISPQSEMKIVS